MSQDQNINSFTTLAIEPIFDSLGNQLHITSSLIGACSVLGHKGFGSGVTTCSMLHSMEEKPGNMSYLAEDRVLWPYSKSIKSINVCRWLTNGTIHDTVRSVGYLGYKDSSVL